MSACLIDLVGGREGDGQVDTERGFGADEGGVEPVEGAGEDGGGVGVAEAGEDVAAPAGEVDDIEGDVGTFVAGVLGQEVGGVVEGVQAGGSVAEGGEGFAVRGR